MAVGTSAVLTAGLLGAFKGTGSAAYGPIQVWAQLHTANPMAVGTNAVSSVTTRSSASWTVSGGTATSSNTPQWATWAGTNGEIVSHISFWDASTAGNFLWSAQLSANKTVNTGDTLTLSSSSLVFTTAF
jgi:hypothetical protein